MVEPAHSPTPLCASTPLTNAKVYAGHLGRNFDTGTLLDHTRLGERQVRDMAATHRNKDLNVGVFGEGGVESVGKCETISRQVWGQV